MQERSSTFEIADIVSRATYLNIVLYGSKSISSFEMARGYALSIASLPQIRFSEELLVPNNEQQAHRAI